MNSDSNGKIGQAVHSVSRRDFLRAGSLGASLVGYSLGKSPRLSAQDSPRARATNLIFLLLVGGPSQIDTWDPKPNAPSSVRGPFSTIRTRVPGLHLSELFTRMAAQADRFAILRSVHHAEAPIHETGHQLLQTGNLDQDSPYPHYGSALGYLYGASTAQLPPFVVLPGPMGSSGLNLPHGQNAGFLEREFDPVCSARSPEMRRAADLSTESRSILERFGKSSLGRMCLQARRLVERGVRVVTINMFQSVFNQITWDCHADGRVLRTTLADYRTKVCPMFDMAFTALLDDLHQRGRLATTMVVAAGEFGRTPRLNSRGGRDHWPGVWSVLFAGGGVRGGRVIGSSDRIGSEARERPVNPAEIAASIYHAFGVARDATLPTPDGKRVQLTSAQPVKELYS